jgi:TM2 domain-containing membrane protein YozV
MSSGNNTAAVETSAVPTPPLPTVPAPPTPSGGGGAPSHVSDIDAWGTADRHLFVYALLAALPFTGFFGLDHVYLRSYGTAMTKFLFNIVSLGFWYMWDAAQVLSPPDREMALKQGLNSPFEWFKGIGRGVFGDGWFATGPSPPKSYLLYTLLSVPLLGVLGLNKLYVGQPSAFVVKILTLIIFPLAIIWALLDFGRVLFFTESVLQEGIPGAPKGWWPLDSLVPHTGCDVFTLANPARCKVRTNTENPDTEGKGFLYKILYWIGENIIEKVIPSQANVVRTTGDTVKMAANEIAAGLEKKPSTA